jgi:hypothetical protein
LPSSPQRDRIRRAPPPKMMRARPTRMTIAGAARVALTLALLSGFLANVVPLAAVSAGSTCTLACCAGRAPHVAGSCMDGSCHAAIRSHHRKTRRHHGSIQTEKLCGLSNSVQLKFRPRPLLTQRTAKTDLTRASAATLKKPCLPECGVCVSGFSNSNQDKKSTTPSAGSRERSPGLIVLADIRTRHVQAREEFCSLAGPRGPPIFFS